MCKHVLSVYSSAKIIFLKSNEFFQSYDHKIMYCHVFMNLGVEQVNIYFWAAEQLLPMTPHGQLSVYSAGGEHRATPLWRSCDSAPSAHMSRLTYLLFGLNGPRGMRIRSAVLAAWRLSIRLLRWSTTASCLYQSAHKSTAPSDVLFRSPMTISSARTRLPRPSLSSRRAFRLRLMRCECAGGGSGILVTD